MYVVFFEQKSRITIWLFISFVQPLMKIGYILVCCRPMSLWVKWTPNGGLQYCGPYAEIHCGPNCYRYTIWRKNTFNPNYTCTCILNQFMLFYKDNNIEHKNETWNAWNWRKDGKTGLIKHFSLFSFHKLWNNVWKIQLLQKTQH